MIDGIHVGEHLVLVALGIDEVGKKHVLGLYEGATENETVCTALISDLTARGLRTDRSMLFVIDGSKALSKAIRAVFGKRAIIQRCQVHKRRNVEDHLPEDMKKGVGRTISTAYKCGDAARAKRMLEALAASARTQAPVGSRLAARRARRDAHRDALRTAARARAHARDDQPHRIPQQPHPQDDPQRHAAGTATMVLRWVALALDEASKTFRKLRGYEAMPKLVAALRAHDAQLDTKSVDGSKRSRVIACTPPPKFNSDSGRRRRACRRWSRRSPASQTGR